MRHAARTAQPALPMWPTWLPDEARHYLAHVAEGAPLRELARRSGCHASTILRQVRRMESRRDDPLVDAALRDLSEAPRPAPREIKSAFSSGLPEPTEELDEDRLTQEAVRVLRRMCESGAVLAVVPDMEKAVVVRETASGTTQRIAVVDTAIAQAMALKDWIACKTPGRISRYAITATGRAELTRLLAKTEQRASSVHMGLAEGTSEFEHASPVTEATPRSRRVRYGLSETPLSVLARRRGRDGHTFLTPDLVAAGERLREDFELAQMGPRVAQNWESFLTGPARGTTDVEPGDNAARARARMEAALHELGPGLGDMALRCCCYLEGLEQAERDMGWAARSGKVVLRIALQRLKRHYETIGGVRGGMIG